MLWSNTVIAAVAATLDLTSNSICGRFHIRMLRVVPSILQTDVLLAFFQRWERGEDVRGIEKRSDWRFLCSAKKMNISCCRSAPICFNVWRTSAPVYIAKNKYLLKMKNGFLIIFLCAEVQLVHDLTLFLGFYVHFVCTHARQKGRCQVQKKVDSTHILCFASAARRTPLPFWSCVHRDVLAPHCWLLITRRRTRSSRRCSSKFMCIPETNVVCHWLRVLTWRYMYTAIWMKNVHR